MWLALSFFAHRSDAAFSGFYQLCFFISILCCLSAPCFSSSVVSEDVSQASLPNLCVCVCVVDPEVKYLSQSSMAALANSSISCMRSFASDLWIWVEWFLIVTRNSVWKVSPWKDCTVVHQCARTRGGVTAKWLLQTLSCQYHPTRLFLPCLASASFGLPCSQSVLQPISSSLVSSPHPHIYIHLLRHLEATNQNASSRQLQSVIFHLKL